MQSAGEPSRPAGSHNPVAGDQQGQRIGAAGPPHGPGKPRVAEGPGQFAVCPRFPMGDAQEKVPDLPLKRGGFSDKGRVRKLCRALPAGKQLCKQPGKRPLLPRGQGEQFSSVPTQPPARLFVRFAGKTDVHRGICRRDEENGKFSGRKRPCRICQGRGVSGMLWRLPVHAQHLVFFCM